MILALLLQAAAAAPAPAPWTVTTTLGTKTLATATSAWASDGSARLVLRCDAGMEKIVSIQFIPKAGFAAALPRPVSINADDDGWLGTNWQFPGNGAFVSDDAIVTNLAVVLARGRSIRMRAMSPDNLPVDATFAGPGEAPVRRVLAACGYGLGVVPARSMVKAPPQVDPVVRPAPEDDQ